MRKIVEYSIVQGESQHKLVKNVTLAIADGFEPIGGVTITESGTAIQAVVKYEDEFFDGR